MGFGVSSTLSSCPTCGCVDTSCEGCCNVSHQSWRQMRIKSGIRIEWVSSAWMGVEVLGSIGFGVISGSFALLAFGGDSLVELVSGIAVLAGLRKDSSIIAGRGGMHRKTTERFT